MPVRLFFAMDKQIGRIRAETDLRSLAIANAAMVGESTQKVRQSLVVEQGEVFQVAHSQLVRAERGAIQKLKALMS